MHLARGFKLGQTGSALVLCLQISSLMTTTATAQTTQICAQLKDLTAHAASNFLVDKEDAKAIVPLNPLPDAQKCTMSRALSGANAYHCAWAFPYRAREANNAFISFNQTIGRCFSGATESVVDQSVNHPDSYQHWEHLSDKISIGVSIKDKSSLQETYVFIVVKGQIAEKTHDPSEKGSTPLPQ